MGKESDQPLKFSEWRPIGVCDHGRANQRSARMFSKRDFEKICSPGVDRKNWENIPQIRMLVESYAMEVARFSNLAKDMKKPGIVGIKLVGAVLGHDETPGLNLESKDGKVQLFQVEYEETAKPRAEGRFGWVKYLLYALLGIAALLAMIPLLNLDFQSSQNSSKRGTGHMCNNRSTKPYLQTLKGLRRDLMSDLKGLPEWSRLQSLSRLCAEAASGIQEQEIVFLRCLLNAREDTQKLGSKKIPGILRMEGCADSLCGENLQHLQPYCRRL